MGLNWNNIVENKQIVIIIDGAVQTSELAGNIAALIGEYQGYSATIVSADAFSAADLLPASVFFVGCGEPEPPSFLYIETLFKHINMAGRFCGVFSSSAKGIKYLSALVQTSETALGKPFMAKNGVVDKEKLHNWLQGIL
jgi:hypothetical protein